MEELSPEELVDSFVFPVKLTKKQQQQADEDLRAARKKAQAEMTDEVRLSLGLLRLKFLLEDYIKGDLYDEKFSFGYFLKEYVTLLRKRRKAFADDISINETLLSQLINLKREPPEYLMVRLEIHSNNVLPAGYWLKLVEKRREHDLKNNKELRKKEKKFVQNKLNVSI